MIKKHSRIAPVYTESENEEDKYIMKKTNASLKKLHFSVSSLMTEILFIYIYLSHYFACNRLWCCRIKCCQ